MLFFYLQMESSFGKDFAIVAKLALSGSLATSRPYKNRGGGGGVNQFIIFLFADGVQFWQGFRYCSEIGSHWLFGYLTAL